MVKGVVSDDSILCPRMSLWSLSSGVRRFLNGSLTLRDPCNPLICINFFDSFLWTPYCLSAGHGALSH